MHTDVETELSKQLGLILVEIIQEEEYCGVIWRAFQPYCWLGERRRSTDQPPQSVSSKVYRESYLKFRYLPKKKVWSAEFGGKKLKDCIDRAMKKYEEDK
jgi:hypothetical protein